MPEETPDGAKYHVEVTNSTGVVIGDGAQLIQHIHMEAPAPELPPLVELEPPPDTTGFVGRATEVTALVERLRTRHVAIIAGMPGVGKSWLAAAVARRVAGVDGDGGDGDCGDRQIFWHRFHQGYKQAEGVESLIWRCASFLALHGDDNLRRRLAAASLPPFDVLIDYAVDLLAGHGFLICLDDFHLVDEDPWIAELTRRLLDLAAAGKITLVVVSRRMPAFARDGEPTGGLSSEDTAALLASRGVPLSAETVAALNSATGGNAQLLMLAANAIEKGASPAELLARLAESEDVEQYLLAEVHRNLSKEERAVMSAVAILLGYSGTRDALEAVVDDDIEAETLNALAQRCLLSVSRSAAGRVYGQHAILQAFYYGQLGRRGRREMHKRAGEYYASQERDSLVAARHFERAGEHARAAAMVSGDIWGIINRGQARGLGQLLDELAEGDLAPELAVPVRLGRGEVYKLLRESAKARESYEAAFTVAASSPGAAAMRQLAARACQGMGELLKEDTPEEALEWCDRGLALLPEEEGPEIGPLRAALLIQAGAARTSMGDFAEARESLQQGLALLPPGPSKQRASGLNNLGTVLSKQGDSEGAVARYSEALEISRQLRDPWMTVGMRNNVAIEMETAGDWQGAAAEYHAALALAQELGSRTDEADLELNLGFLATRQGDDAAALAHLERCRAIASEGSLRLHLVYAFTGLADLYLRQGEPGAAAPLLAGAERLANEIDARDRLPEIGFHTALLRLADGDLGAALAQAEAAAALAHELEMPVEEAVSLRVRGQVLHAAGHTADALAACEASLALLVDEDPYEAARTQAVWGSILRACGNASEGRALLQEAYETFAKLGARRDLEGVA